MDISVEIWNGSVLLFLTTRIHFSMFVRVYPRFENNISSNSVAHVSCSCFGAMSSFYGLQTLVSVRDLPSTWR